jgi:hypothetical protein
VIPWLCHNPDRNGNHEWLARPDENGKCRDCGRPLTELGLARVREGQALKELEFRQWETRVAEQKEEERVRQLGVPADLVVRASSDEAKAMLAKLRAEWEAESGLDQPSDAA